MAVFNFTGFEAEADVLGLLRQVRYGADGDLVIRGLTMTQAKAALTRLGTGLVAISIDEEATTQVVPIMAEVEINLKKTEPVLGTAASKAAAKTESEASAKANALAAEQERHGSPSDPVETKKDPATADDLPGTMGQGGAGPAPAEAKPAEPKLVLVPAPAAAVGSNGGGDILAKLKDAPTLKALAEMLIANGHDTVESAVKVCEEHKADIPILRKIRDVEDRVRRVWELVRA